MGGENVVFSNKKMIKCVSDKLIIKAGYKINVLTLCNGFHIEFRQNFAKETFSYDEHLKS